MSTRARVTSFGRSFAGGTQDTETTSIVVSLAYYAAVSLISLVLFLLAVVTTPFSQDTATVSETGNDELLAQQNMGIKL